MTPEVVVDVFRQCIYTTCILVVVLVLPGLIVGLLVAMFQAATQINEMSMSFVPKFLVTLILLGFMSPWVLHIFIEYTTSLYKSIPDLIG